MDRPTDLFDRGQEWDDLVGFATGGGTGIRLALVRGRRRQGKPYLLIGQTGRTARSTLSS